MRDSTSESGTDVRARENEQDRPPLPTERWRNLRRACAATGQRAENKRAPRVCCAPACASDDRRGSVIEREACASALLRRRVACLPCVDRRIKNSIRPQGLPRARDLAVLQTLHIDMVSPCTVCER